MPEYRVEGIDGRELLEKSSRIPVELVLHVGTEIARALEYVHAAKDAQGQPLESVHRDISPDNILIGWDGAVKLTDFGITKGKLSYMAPEQGRAEEFDGRADLFALGCTLHELATGHSPLEDDEVRTRAVSGIDPPLSESLDEDLQIILESVLRADRNRRLSDAQSLAKACAAALDARSLEDRRIFAREWLARLRPPSVVVGALSHEDAVADTIMSDPTRPEGPGGPARVFQAGDHVADRYRIIRFLGRGGMGEVYEARDLELGATIALKTIRRELARGSAVFDQFRREVLLARKVTHANVCRIFDVDFHENTAFLTMELLIGRTLRSRVRDDPIDEAEAVAIAAQIAEGIDTAHRQGIIHRDLKSENIFLTENRDGSLRVVITDFGLARVHGEAGDGSLEIASSGGIKGTPAYMAPEQVLGKEVTPRTDVYAFGVLLYEMGTGKLPFTGETAAEVAVKRLHHPPVPPRAHRPELSPKWEQAILKCLEREATDRYESAGAVIAELTETKKKRSVRLVPLAVAVALMIAVGAGGFAARHFTESRIENAVDPRIRPSIAMLAFRNKGEADASWVATALGELIRSELSLGDRIRFVAPETVARMKSDLSLGDSEGLAKETLARVKSYAAADMVLTGSYRRDGERTTLELKLQDTARGKTVAGGSFSGGDRDLVDLAARSAESLRTALALPAPKRAEAELARASIPQRGEAQRWYAEGLDALRRLDALPARELFEKALAEEPDHPLLHLGLAEAWSALGYDANAAEEAKLAVEHAEKLPARERLWAEARKAELAKERARSVALYRALFRSFPDDLGYGLRLAESEARAGTSTAVAETFAALRSLPAPLSDDPRIDLLAAKIAGWRGDFKEQRALSESAREKGARIKATQVIAHARYMEGWALRNLGERAAAASAYEEARAHFIKAKDRAGLARSLNDLGIVLRDVGRIDDAGRVYEQSIAIQRELGRRADMAQVLSNFAEVRRLKGDLALASARYEEALALCEEDGQLIGMLVIHANLAEVALDRGNLKEARRLLDRALEESRTLENASLEAYVLNLRGDVDLTAGELVLAERRYREALAIREKIGEKETEIESRLALAKLEIERGRASEAAKMLETLATETASTAPARITAAARLLLARALRESKRAPAAAKAIAELDDTSIESASVRLALDLERARLNGDVPLIAAIAEDAKRMGFAGIELEARLASAEIRRSRADLRALAKNAGARGFGGIARRAAPLR